MRTPELTRKKPIQVILIEKLLAIHVSNQRKITPDPKIDNRKIEALKEALTLEERKGSPWHE